MASTLQIVNTAGTVLLDLNGVNGTDAGSATIDLLHNPDWGAAAASPMRFDYSNAPGGTTTSNRAALTPCTLPIRIRASSYDNMATAVGRLSRLLAEPCTIRWVPNGSTRIRYADVEPSQTPALLDGQELALYKVASLFDTPEGVTLSLMRQPYFRGGELDPAVNILLNSTLLRDTDQASRPDSWTLSSATSITNERIHPTESAYEFDIATTATRQLLQVTPTASVASAETWTMSGYARVTDPAYTNVEAQAMIEFQTSGGAAVSTATGTLVPLTTSWQRLSVSGTAIATTSKAQAGIRIDPTSATSAKVQLRFFQFEKAASASTYRNGVESISSLPSEGRVVYFQNEGDAPAPVQVTYKGTDVAGLNWVYVGVASHDGVTAWGNASRFEAESMTLGADTTATVGGASYSGSGSNRTTSTMATSGLTLARLSKTITTNMEGLRGQRFAVWARVAHSTFASATYTFRLRYAFDSGSAFTDDIQDVNVSMGGLSLYSVPLGRIYVPSDATTLRLAFYADRTSGSSSLFTDYFNLIPTQSFSQVGSTTYPLDTVYVETDPETPSVRAVAAPNGAGIASLQCKGPVPFIAPPGVSGIVVFALAHNTGTTALSPNYGGLTTNTTVQFRYSPRYYL